MRVHVLQHVAHEGPAHIQAWAWKRGHELSSTRFFTDDELPAPDGAGLLVVLGGPMNIYEEQAYPWLVEEKAFLAQALEAGVLTVGICLGAQLIADVLGAKVTANREREIGWFPVDRTAESENSRLMSDFPKSFFALHWHGDTFQIPDGAIRLASSAGCDNQAFEIAGTTVGLQFHLESSEDSIRALTEADDGWKRQGAYVQRAEDMLTSSDRLTESNALMERLLDRMAGPSS